MHKNCGLSRPLFLLPGAFARAINCSEGVFADQRNVWTQYLAAHRRKLHQQVCWLWREV